MANNIRIIILLFSFTFLSYSCNLEKRKEEPKVKLNPHLVLEKVAKHLRMPLVEEIIKKEVQNDSVLNYVYSLQNYHPFFFKDTLNNRQINKLVALLNDSEKDGINNSIFPISQIQVLAEQIDSGLSKNKSEVYWKIAYLDKLSTQSILAFCSGMNFGFVRPQISLPDSYFIKTLSADSAYFKNMSKLLAHDPILAAKNSIPDDKVYQHLKDKYQAFLQLNDKQFEKINYSKNTLYQVGDKEYTINKIEKRLALTGEYTMPVTPDSVSAVCSKNLVNAVNLFREENSLPTANKIDAEVLELMNRPLKYYKNLLKVNLERYRWKRAAKTFDKHVEVNVASAILTAQSNDKRIKSLEMRVCVGKTQTQSPLLSSVFTYINLNPTWTVPKSIAKGEILRQRREPDYLSSHNMIVLRKGEELNPDDIDWDKVNPNNPPFIIRQVSGDFNALGKVKFMFENPFSVYLHDTPIQSAFKRNIRAVSHGCIRLQKPFDLLFFFLDPIQPDMKDKILYSIDKLNMMSAAGKKLAKENQITKIDDIINLKKKISLVIDYRTAYCLPSDHLVRFCNDIYNLDKPILKTLNELKLTDLLKFRDGIEYNKKKIKPA